MSSENTSKSRRTYFINPYTFVPLSEKGPVCSADQQPTHAWLQPDRFTGTIECQLDFITPAVIPGDQKPGVRDEYPGEIKAYTYDGKLAIPGSRIRGQLLNVMRAINSSPVTAYEDRTILKRIDKKVHKGFILHDNDSLSIQEVKDEILVAHKDRINLKTLLGGTEPATAAVCYRKNSQEQMVVQSVVFSFFEWGKICDEHKDDFSSLSDKARKSLSDHSGIELLFSCIEDERTKKIILQKAEAGNGRIIRQPAANNCKNISEYNPDQGLSQGVSGIVYYKHPRNKSGEMKYKKYMVCKDGEQTDGCWVAFPSWSGQDGENRLKGIGSAKAHLNLYHVVDLKQGNMGIKIDLDETVLRQFDESVKEMANLAENDEGKGKDIAQSIRQMSPLKTGDFVYFTKNNQKIESIGRHYRYLCRLGTVKEKALFANKGHKSHDCVVKKLGGWADEDFDPASMKSRLWVEMAIGPDAVQMRKEEKLVFKNLRILSSQPPKASQFYLDDGGYENPGSKIRGRKFYWHDPHWKKPMWDNEDLNNGQHAYENPEPDEDKLKAQWSKAEVLYPVNDGSQKFSFSIRVMNLSPDELNLLLTALVGFIPRNEKSEDNKNTWCHKIGHARPFMGSAKVEVTGLKRLGFNSETWEPETTPVMFSKFLDSGLRGWDSNLKDWQQKNLPDTLPHIKALKRIMSFTGAYSAGEDKLGARIAYPVGQDSDPISWKGKDKYRPKTYTWFGKKNDKLPKPEIEKQSQALPTYTKR